MTWTRHAWTPTAEKALAGALGADGAEIRAEVQAGAATLWRVPGKGWIVTRLEALADRLELVLVAWAGRDSRAIVHHAQHAARASGVASIRFHTAHPPRLITRMVRPWGFIPVEYRNNETVYRWVV